MEAVFVKGWGGEHLDTVVALANERAPAPQAQTFACDDFVVKAPDLQPFDTGVVAGDQNAHGRPARGAYGDVETYVAIKTAFRENGFGELMQARYESRCFR